MKTIVVGTANEGKLNAVRASFEDFGSKYGWSEYSIVPYDSPSGVAATPMSDEDGFIGCENRIAAARAAIPNADMYIALEGIVYSIGEKAYIRGWTMMEDVDTGRIVSASGASVEVPRYISSQIQGTEEFNDLVKDIYPMDEQTATSLRNIGANGAFTQGEYGRQDSFYDGTRICLSLLANSHNWPA